MTRNSLLKLLLNVKGVSVENVDVENRVGRLALIAHVHIHKKERNRCPVCGRKSNVHDYLAEESLWRGMGFGPLDVWIRARVPRVCCLEHGVRCAAVPWARPNSRFTLDFARSVTWMVKSGMNKTKVAQWFMIDWKTVGRLVELVWHELEPNIKNRYAGLKKIGIDETSYKKGHSYITTVVNHETNTVIWAHEGHGKSIIDLFFQELTPEQRASIEVVTGDGARWITDSIVEYCPNAKRCIDSFHVVEWATAALDSVRLDAWKRAYNKWKDMQKPENGDKEAKEAKRAAKKLADDIKSAKYTLGKNPENLTANQQERLAVIQEEDGPLNRARILKEQLRLIFKIKDVNEASESLDKWLSHAQRCRLTPFVELQSKIRRHREHILNTIRYGASNARIEALNNKIKLLIRVAYGFRNIDAMISLILLFCSNITIPHPSTDAPMRINIRPNAHHVA